MKKYYYSISYYLVLAEELDKTHDINAKVIMISQTKSTNAVYLSE